MTIASAAISGVAVELGCFVIYEDMLEHVFIVVSALLDNSISTTISACANAVVEEERLCT